jgi:type IV fimbrial biogenesis protein FimT
MFKPCQRHYAHLFVMLAVKSCAFFEDGFTLIELMVMLTITSVLMMVAVPSFVSYRRNAELTAAANTFLAAVNAARGEAMKRGMNALVVPTGNGSDWNTGWVVFVDKNNTRIYDESVEGTILSQSVVPSGISVSGTNSAVGSVPYVMFDASGYSRLKTGGFGALTLTMTRSDVSGAEQLSQTRRIIVASTGRVRICKPTSTTDSNCPSSVNQITGQ